MGVKTHLLSSKGNLLFISIQVLILFCVCEYNFLYWWFMWYHMPSEYVLQGILIVIHFHSDSFKHLFLQYFIYRPMCRWVRPMKNWPGSNIRSDPSLYLNQMWMMNLKDNVGLNFSKDSVCAPFCISASTREH